MNPSPHTKTAILLLLILILAGCTPAPAAPTPTTMAPKSTPYPTYTPQPTYTPYPTLTPAVIKLEIPQIEGEEYWPDKPLDREFYAYQPSSYYALDPDQDVREAYIEMLKTAEETWIGDPLFVALQYAGYPNVDAISPSRINVYKNRDGKVTVVISHFNLGDDSIQDKEYRIDLIYVDGTWEIDWAGYRQRCRRSSFDGWITGLCP